MEITTSNQKSSNEIAKEEPTKSLGNGIRILDLSKCLNISVNLEGWPACISAIGLAMVITSGYCFCKLRITN